MSLPYTKRLMASEVFTGEDPWNFQASQPFPKEIFKDKSARTLWSTSLKTDHQFYSGFVGLNSSLRISEPKSDGSGNAPHSLLALLADYDHPMTEAMAINCAESMRHQPNWIERTLSGNWRFVWTLEKPVGMPSYSFAVHFLKSFKSFAFDPSLGGVGFDEPAWCNPTRYYTNSLDWQPLNPTPIPDALARGWVIKASETFKWSSADLGVEMPLEEVIPALRAKYPNFAGWPGEFVVGAMGPSFWVEGSVSPKSAIVRETGLYTFAAHAAKSFYSWADLLGGEFVRDKLSLMASKRAEDIFFDSMLYWRKDAHGNWITDNKDRLMLHLKVDRKVSHKRDKAGDNDIDRCLSFVHNHQRIQGAAPFCFRPPGIIVEDGERRLNLGTPSVLSPCEGPVAWGAGGAFPWISDYLEGVFTRSGTECLQLERFLAWLKRFYTCGIDLEPQPGQAIFIVGPASVGKTFLSQAIVGGLVGGHAEANRILLGEDSFGSEMYHRNLWTIDDATVNVDSRTHRTFTEQVKKTVANLNFNYHAKFRVPTKVSWSGRIIVTLNGDAISVSLLPSTDRDNQDKLMFFQAASRFPNFGGPRERREMLDRELPAFARWLLDWTPPPHCGYGHGRFGVIPFAHEDLAQSAHQANPVSSFADILADFLKVYFDNNEAATEWRGNAQRLHRSICEALPGIEGIMRGIHVNRVNQNMATLMGWKKQRFLITSTTEDDSLIWVIQKQKPTGDSV